MEDSQKIDEVIVLSQEEYQRLLNGKNSKGAALQKANNVSINNNNPVPNEALEQFAYKLDLVYNYVLNQLDNFRSRADYDYVCVKEVVEYLKVSRRTMQRHMENGLIPYLKIGRNVRFQIKDIKEAVKSRVIKTKIERLHSLIDNFTPIR